MRFSGAPRSTYLLLLPYCYRPSASRSADGCRVRAAIPLPEHGHRADLTAENRDYCITAKSRTVSEIFISANISSGERNSAHRLPRSHLEVPPVLLVKIRLYSAVIHKLSSIHSIDN